MMVKHTRHDAAHERVAIDELLSRFPATGRDRTWNIRPVVSSAFKSAHRIFDKNFKNKLKEKKTEA
jgi:hypothetical protein